MKVTVMLIYYFKAPCFHKEMKWHSKAAVANESVRACRACVRVRARAQKCARRVRVRAKARVRKSVCRVRACVRQCVRMRRCRVPAAVSSSFSFTPNEDNIYDARWCQRARARRARAFIFIRY